VTDAGTVPDFELLDSFTTVPPGIPARLSVTVPIEEEPPVTALGLRLTDTSAGGGGGLIVRVTADEVFPTLAVSFAIFGTDTAAVLTVKVAEASSGTTVTVFGTVAAALPLDRVTSTPRGPALPVNTAVP